MLRRGVVPAAAAAAGIAAVAAAGAAGGRARDRAGRAGTASAPAAAARGIRGVISAAGPADGAGRAIVAGARARAAVLIVRVARSAHRTGGGILAAGVAAGIGDEAWEHDAAIDAVITHKIRPPEISLGDGLRSIL